MGLVQRPINPKLKDMIIGLGKPKRLVKAYGNVRNRKK